MDNARAIAIAICCLAAVGLLAAVHLIDTIFFGSC
jgi:hypothetical protein